MKPEMTDIFVSVSIHVIKNRRGEAHYKQRHNISNSKLQGQLKLLTVIWVLCTLTLVTLAICPEKRRLEHVDAATNFNNLSSVYHSLGDLQRAREC